MDLIARKVTQNFRDSVPLAPIFLDISRDIVPG